MKNVSISVNDELFTRASWGDTWTVAYGSEFTFSHAGTIAGEFGILAAAVGTGRVRFDFDSGEVAYGILLGLRCKCFDPDTSPPTDWGPGKRRVRIPHHCECPFAPFDLPDPETAPTAYAWFMKEREQLITEQEKIK